MTALTTQTNEQLFAFSEHGHKPRTLKEVHDDLQTEMLLLKTLGQDVYAQGAALFKTLPEAKTDIIKAEELLVQLRAVGKVPVPEHVSPLMEQPGAMPSSACQDEYSKESEEATSEETDEPEETDASDVMPVATLPERAQELVPSAVTWPAEALGAGLISQLARTLSAGEMATLVLARMGDELLITVQPKPIAHEPPAIALELQVRGEPAALDHQLVDALHQYVAGRQVAREVAGDYAAQVRAAAAKQKSASSAKTPVTPKTQGAATLSLEVSPQDAVLVLSDKAGKTHPVQHGKDLSLPAGEYRLIAQATGYESQTESFTLKAFARKKMGIVLVEAAQPSMFEN